MIIRNLDAPSLRRLLESVFGLRSSERDLTILIDLPTEKHPDNPGWMDLRRLATEWYGMMREMGKELPFSGINCVTYENVGTNNGPLPGVATVVDRWSRHAETPRPVSRPLSEILQASSVVLAMTELSATAPLKLMAKQFKFRGATLPGFTRAMIPALGLDYSAVNARVIQIKTLLDRAARAKIRLRALDKIFQSNFDLRFRTAHASGGILEEEGMVGNLPSGEAYIVPYEGENPAIASETEGLLPVQFGDEVVVFRLDRNKAVGVLTTGPQSQAQLKKLEEEPAYGNIAELGIGVLGEWGVQGVGSTLLDEKLGLHVAFGRSDHFGGATSPGAFRNPDNVIHVDWVYVPSVQPLVSAEEVVLQYPSGKTQIILRSGKLSV
jgi:hypothetical protein